MTRSGLIPRPRTARCRARAAVLAALLAALAPLNLAADDTAQLVADINPGPATGGTDNYYYSTRFVVLGDRALFGVDDGIHGNELWATDGTVAGTALVADLCPGACSSLPRGDRARR